MIEFFNPLTWMKWIGQFVVLWARSTPVSAIVGAIPAVLLIIGLGTLTYVSQSDGGSWRRNLIEQQMVSSVKAEDYDTAELVIRRQIANGNDSTETLYQLAVIQSELDRPDEAEAMMTQLALGRRNDRAATWLIQERYLGKTYAELDNEAREKFGRLLELLAESKPKDFGIKQLFADYLIASGRYGRAIPLLRELAMAQPMRGLQAASLARREGQTELSDRLAGETLKRLTDLFAEEPANPALVMAIVQNLIYLERHADAVRTISESIPRMNTPEHRQVLQQAMGDTIAAWVSLIEQQKNDTPIERLRVLKMLQVALQYAPNNPRVLTLVADQVLKTLDNNDDEIQALRTALVEGTSPGIAHFVRGTVGLLKENHEVAERHLTLASKHLPNSGAILNNLAVAISQRDGGDLEKALMLSEKAIETVDQPSPYFYETRGQILFRMKRYLDAIPDLERALQTKELAGEAHRSIAECYEQLGQADMAKDHRDAAERSQ